MTFKLSTLACQKRHGFDGLRRGTIITRSRGLVISGNTTSGHRFLVHHWPSLSGGTARASVVSHFSCPDIALVVFFALLCYDVCLNSATTPTSLRLAPF
jgi:hypothetical protein